MQSEYPFPDAPIDAGTALFDQYGELIFMHIRAQVQLREDAEDITTEVFTAALENQPILHATRSEQLAWLRRVARNKVIDYYRRQKRRPVVVLDSIADSLLDEALNNPEFTFLMREQQTQLHQHISELPPLQQHILRLRYGHSLRCAEIGQMVEKSEAAVRQLLSRSIRQLRARFTTLEKEERA
ncbi:RNA polymerase sigma factor [Ktedonospora formicarum]|uniref:Uncharacterized protein n=1 Tax=Ktedonospora formicarum TaxID=2778364 RepID=A0A8J3I9Y5_9CHLR|nr:sigma-70 family RNA polymerase sigma factor [Ktedonospora formicarum]GHO49500.1 hypothetical protein KSX_76630 [Ktedonospora formicarum]